LASAWNRERDISQSAIYDILNVNSYRVIESYGIHLL